MSCEECRFWQPLAKGAPNGECRESSPRFAPPALDDVFRVAARGWPSTAAQDWCGKFMRHDPVPAGPSEAATYTDKWLGWVKSGDTSDVYGASGDATNDSDDDDGAR